MFILLAVREPWCAKLAFITRLSLAFVNQLQELGFVNLFGAVFGGFGQLAGADIGADHQIIGFFADR